MYELSQIAQILGGRLAGAHRPGGAAVRGFSIDTRTLVAGDLFFALTGARVDGQAFLEEAARLGAAGAVVTPSGVPERPPLPLVVVQNTLHALQKLGHIHRKSLETKVVAVTGSCGKTTTTRLLAEMLGRRGPCVATAGNQNNHIGVPLTLLGLEETTRYAAVEMGCNHEGEIAFLARLADPDAGLVTCVAPAHTQFLGGIDGVARAKGELFLNLRPDAVSVVNLDDDRVKAMPLVTRRRLTFGTKARRGTGADVELVAARPDGAAGQRVTLRVGEREAAARLGLAGEHNAVNATAAAAAALAAGATVEQIVAGIEAMRPIGGRGIVLHARGITVIDDSYNASPAAMEAALKGLWQMDCAGRKIAILGDMYELGEEAERWHRQAGGEAALAADILVAVGEQGGLFIQGAAVKGMAPESMLAFADAREAAEALRALHLVKEGDIVLVKGSRAMHMERIVEALAGEEAGQ